MEKKIMNRQRILIKCLLYNVPMNINGYVPILINTLDTIVRGINMLIK